MQKKNFLLGALATALLALPTFVSCNSDDSGDEPNPIFTPAGKNGAVVVNQATMGNGKASWGLFTYSNNTTTFQLTLDGTLGDTPQNVAKVGDYYYVGDAYKQYVGVYNSSLDKVTEIALPAPQGVTAAGDLVLAIGGDSVYAINPATNKRVAQIYAGSNIYALAVANNSVYVTQAMDWTGTATQKNYVLKFNLSDFNAGGAPTPTKIEVGLNPYNQIITDAQGNVFVVCVGDYGYFTGVNPEVWKIDNANVSTKVGDGSFIAERNGTLFVIEKGLTATDYSFKTYNTANNALVSSNFLASASTTPARGITFLGVNPYSGYLYIGSAENGYKNPGFVYEYKADGTFLTKHTSGANPYTILFY